MIARRLGDRPASIADDLVLRRRPRRQAERRPPVQRRQQRCHDDDDPREDEPVLRHDAVEDRHRAGRENRRRRLQGIAEDHDHSGFQDEQEAERRGQLGERRRVPEWAEDRQLDEDAERGHADERQREGRDGREREAEVVGSERPEDVRGEHRDRAGRQVDDPRAPVDEDDTERDARDERAGAEPEHREEDVVAHRSVVCGAGGPGNRRARRRFCPDVYFTPGGFSQLPTSFHLPLPRYS